MLPPGSPEPGRFRSARTPFFIPVVDAFSDHRYEIIIGVCGSQMGKTENVLNVIGHRFTDNPTPTLFIGATEKQVRSISQDRVEKMIRSTSMLWERLEKRADRNKVTEKYFAGIRLGFGWAGSPAELSSHPAGQVLLDEIDRFPLDAGNEGDPVLLAQARTKNYSDSKIGGFSTPTIEGASKIWTLFESGTMGMWSIPCPHCNEYFIPRLSLLIWKEGSSPEEARHNARLHCSDCGAAITTEQKMKANADGRYIYHVMKDDKPERYGFEPPENSTASFWISGIMSPWVTLGELAYLILTAYRSGDQETIQAAINTYGGELFKMEGDAPDHDEVRKLIGGYEPLTIPEGVQLATLGADVQKYGIYYVIRGWGYNSESWKLDNGYLAGETKYNNVFITLGRIISQLIDGKHIDRAFIDSGYNAAQVYNFCRRFPGLAYPTKGHDTQDKALKASKIDLSYQGKTIRNGLTLWHIHTDYFKTWIYSRIRWEEGQPGGYHLDNATDEDYLKQLVAEQLIIKPSGRRVWVQTIKDNHYLDCEVGAAAAASALHVHTLRPWSKPKEKPAAIQKKAPFIKKSNGAFIRS